MEVWLFSQAYVRDSFAQLELLALLDLKQLFCFP